MSNKQLRRAAIAIVCTAVALAACGQKGPLFLPDEASEVVTRPTQTPIETTTPTEVAPATPSEGPPPTPEAPPAPPNPTAKPDTEQRKPPSR
jgi:predicted small lipoprotein YifL